MNKVALSGTPRTISGTKGAAQLRREQRVPCVLYGGEGTIHFSVDEAALRKVIFSPEVNEIELDLNGSKTLALVHEKQFHPLSDRVIHVDFMEMKEDRETRVLLSVHLKGQPVGVRNGGKLNQNMRKLRVIGLPVHIPQHLEVNVADLDINDSIKVGDLKYEGLVLLERATDVVAAVKMLKKVEEVAPVAAAGAVPAAAAGAPVAGAAATDAKPGADAKPAAKK